MLKNYFKIAIRGIIRNKAYSFINILGLAIGMICCFLIFLWVNDELNYDTFHENYKRIYMVGINAQIGDVEKCYPLCNAPAGPAMMQDYPEVENYVRVWNSDKKLVNYNNKKLYINNVQYAENQIFDIFTYPIIYGNKESALTAPYSVVMTESTARKFFNDSDPVGKMVQIDQDKMYTVTAVIKDVPKNTNFDIDMMISYPTIDAEGILDTKQWINFNQNTFLLLNEKNDPKALEEKLVGFVDQYMGPQLKAMNAKLSYFLNPISKVHLYSGYDLNIPNGGNMTQIYLFSGIAIFILLIACFNFINISTARSANRAKEVGIRKTCGAVKTKLIGQFLGESVIYSFIALIIALISLEIILPFFNSFTGKDLSVGYTEHPLFIVIFIGISIVVGLLAGSYPALFLSSFKPITVLKTKMISGGSESKLRRTLVVTQFTISIMLIIGTLTIYHQINYMKNKSLGFHGEQVLVIEDISDNLQNQIGSLLRELKQVPGVINAASADFVPGQFASKQVYLPEGFTDEQTFMMNVIEANPDYLPTIGIELAEGRNFSADLATDSSESILINETAARTFGWDQPVGKIIKSRSDGNDLNNYTDLHVIGVVKDFHLGSLHEKIEPVMIRYGYDNIDVICLRLDPNNISGAIDDLSKRWEELTSGYLFEYRFLDDSFNELYLKEEKLSTITLWFSILAVLLGCLGLYGLSAYIAERRTKEIGIRKVLGASFTGLVALLSKEFLILVGISNLIAWPIAYYLLNDWLESFAYRIDLGILTFIFAGLLGFVIVIATISFQAIKAARTNPIESLRYE